MADLSDGARAVRQLSEALERSGDLPAAFAEAVLSEARRRAAGKPTPQSRMAAEAMGVRGSEILTIAGGDAAEVAGGSEWGSVIYTQFGPRNEGGYWLMPSTESPVALAAGDRALDEAVQRAVNRYG